MDQQYLFANLPQEITIDILSRLPFHTIINCKRVCKPWRHLLSTPEFVGCHSLKSLPGLILSRSEEAGDRYKVVEFGDSRHRPCKTVCYFSVLHKATLQSPANGLLLFVNHENHQTLFVCNPMTREYINLPPPTDSPYHRVYYGYGFGVSKVSGEYKVLRISMPPSYKFEVYTLGTGTWRNVLVPDGGVALPHHCPCVFVDGKLYSLVNESCMSCFDLETEVFSTVSCPPSRGYMKHVCALGGRLCLCLNGVDEVVIWLMKELGEWRKEFVICKAKMGRHRYDSSLAIKELGHGEMLLVKEGRIRELYHYSKTRKRKRDILKPITVTKKRIHFYRVSYTPTFLPLKTFAIENVCNF